MSAAPDLSIDDIAAPRTRNLKAERPSLRVVAARQPKLGRNAFGLLIGAILLAGLLAVLLLNTVLAQGAFAIHGLELKATELDIAHQELASEVAALDTPAALEQRARALGMVQVSNPVFLRLHGHRVIGKPDVAQAPAVPAPAKPLPSAVTPAAPTGDAAAKPPAKAAKPAPAQPATEPAASGDGAVVVTKP